MGPQPIGPLAETRAALARALGTWDATPANRDRVDELEVAYGNHAVNVALPTPNLRDIVGAYRRAGFTPAQALQAIEHGVGKAARG